MTKAFALGFLVVCSAAASAQRSAAPVDPATVVQRAIDAQGGEAALLAIRSVRVEAAGHEHALEQSERPEGPFIVSYEQMTEVRDFEGSRVRRLVQQRSAQTPEWVPSGVAIVSDADTAAMNNGERWFPARPLDLLTAQRTLELGPERLLLTAKAAPGLKTEPDITLHGMKHHVVSFPWRGRTVRLILNSYNGLPAASEITGPDDLFTMWGDTTVRTYYSYWNLEKGGLRYPKQTDVEWNGIAKASATVLKLEINPVSSGADFAIPDDVRKAFAAMKPGGGFQAATLQSAQAKEIAPGVVQLPGSWNVTLVRQDDGLVIVEAPIASSYSVQVLDEAAKRYPGVPIRAVVTTSDAWPHLGGVREYAARGVPIFALDLNRGILERLLKAPFISAPDGLAKAPKAARFTWVSAKTTLGTGPNRIELYPVRGENGERMMMAWFPGHRLLYSSDEIMRDRSGAFFMPQFLTEVRDAIAREKLDVARVFGMHLRETPWSEVEGAIKKAGS